MKSFVKLTAVTMLMLSSAMVSMPATAASSTFQNSCQNMALRTNGDGAWVTAQCRTRAGSYNNTSIAIYGLVNDDGRLRGQGGAPSSFQHSCRNSRLQWSPDMVRIAAVCKTRSGAERETSIELSNIENIDGRLTRVRR